MSIQTVFGLLLATVVAIEALRIGSPDEGTPYIAKGVAAKEGDYPYMCSLRSNEQHKCGAVIINEDWLLTAARCVDGIEPKDLLMRCGTVNVMSPGVMFDVTKIIIHDDYNPRTFDSDIAVMKTKSKLTLGAKHMDKIELAGEGDPLSTSAMITVMGWGGIDTLESPTILQTLDVPIIASDVCSGNYGTKVTERMFCAGYEEEGKGGLCVGDFGGPAKHDGKLVGLIARDDGCAKKGKPGVYTRVSSFRDWIKQNTGV